jgi:hypothetical protein
MASRYNIFKDFLWVKETVSKNEGGLYNDLMFRVIEALERYLISGSWASSESEKLIARHQLQGLSCSLSAKSLGINENTYRSKLSRLNVKLSGLIFDGEKVSSILTLSDSAKLKEVYMRLLLLTSSFNFYDEVSSSVIQLVNKLPYTEGSDFSEPDVFNALAFLAMHSKSVIEFQLKSLNIPALDMVIASLSESTMTKEMGYFRSLQDNYKKAFNMKPETIEKIKEKI